jgi:UrcA family protein
MTILTSIRAAALIALIAMGIVGAMAVASHALAGETIQLNDYDLTRVEDTDRLQLDIVRAATQGCQIAYRGWEHGGVQAQVKSCVAHVVDYTVAQAQVPSLSQLHASIDADQRYDDQRAPANTQSASAE